MTTLSEDQNLRVIDYVCTASSGDAPFEEVHERYSLSFVRRGSFGCQARGQRHELFAGGFFVGAPGDVFACTHDHHHGGDECLSFQFSAALAEEIGGDRAVWSRVSVPPISALSTLGALAQATAARTTDLSLAETGMLLAARFVDVMRGDARARLSPSSLDRVRVIRATEWIEANHEGQLSLDAAAQQAGLSPFHFLRIFSKVVGATPNQFWVSCRLRHAAEMLLGTDQSVTEIALSAGFGDLSNFQRSFKRAAGVTPGAFRRMSEGDRKILQVWQAASALG
ncbi:hypothetical protein BBF93_02655 [Hyphomonas sp. CACIAM 19H1]|nr:MULTISPECIES: AraC family transcriptional regulator [Hyphomonas]AXE63235.1 hypothetical protein BBF93_02655 [Hyphomonas sp. CACIAM 19H1]